MTDRQPPDWNPRDTDVLAGQRRAHDEMRERCPLARSDAMNWSIFRHQDVHAMPMDPDTFSNASRHHAIPNAMNEPEHTKHRHLLEPYFSREQMAAIEPHCREIAADAVANLLCNAVEELLKNGGTLSLASDRPPSRETYPGNGFSELLVRAG